MINKTSITGSILLISFIGLFSCQKLSKSIQDTFSGDTIKITEAAEDAHSVRNNKNEKVADFMSNRQALQEAENLFRNRPELKGKEIKIYNTIHFYRDYRIMLKIQNPDNPTYVDSYSYKDGMWGEPEPVVMSKSDDIAGNIVNLDRIPFVNANNVYKELISKLTEIGNKTADLTVYVSTYKNRVTWYPRTISNERSRYSIDFNEDGTLQSFEQE